MYRDALQNLCVPRFAFTCFCLMYAKYPTLNRAPLRKKSRNLLRDFRHFSLAVVLPYRQLSAKGYQFFRSGHTIPPPTHLTRPLSVHGSPFSRTMFVCHISVSSSSVSLPASASSSNAGANAQRLGQSSIERRLSDTLFPCQLKSVQSVPS